MEAAMADLVYYAELQREKAGGFWISFPDVPEALTSGDTRKEAVTEAQDALIAALGTYVKDGRALPAPRRRRGLIPIALPPLVAAKLALHAAMQEDGISGAALAKRLTLAKRVKTADTTVRRLLDLDHRSHIGEIEAALEALGRHLTVRVGKLAAA
jgi:antitoxin HicB